MAKVILSDMSNHYLVAPDAYGEEHCDAGGVSYLYFPIPFCRVPWGVGRDQGQAYCLATQIARLIDHHGVSSHGEARYVDCVPAPPPDMAPPAGVGVEVSEGDWRSDRPAGARGGPRAPR